VNERFGWNPTQVAEILRRRGYDVDETDARLGGGGSIAARRERSDRAQLVVVDATGRFKAEITAIESETSRRVEVAGVEARVVELEQRVTAVTAMLPDGAALAPLLDALDRLGDLRAGSERRPSAPRS